MVSILAVAFPIGGLVCFLKDLTLSVLIVVGYGLMRWLNSDRSGLKCWRHNISSTTYYQDIMTYKSPDGAVTFTHRIIKMLVLPLRFTYADL